MSDQLFEAIVLLVVHVSIVVAAIGAIRLWTKVDQQKALATIGLTGIALFVVCIGIPFFFQGYAEWNPTSEPEALGWTRNPVIGLYAYLYTFKWMGFAWLFTSIVSLALGRLSAKVAVDTIAKSTLILLACILLTRID